MKKLILGIVIGAILFAPAAVMANEYFPLDGLRGAKDIYQFNCDDGYVRGAKCNHVAVFDDKDNKCYISYDSRGTQSSISCVRR